MSEHQKKDFNLLNVNDKLRYDRELSVYKNNDNSRTLYIKKETLQRKHSTSAFGLFLKANFQNIKKNSENQDARDVFKIASN